MKYSKNIMEAICKSLEEGVLEKDAGPINGISERTYFDWKNKYPEFKKCTQKSIVTYKYKLIQELVKTPKGPIHVLRARWPEEWNPEYRNIGNERLKDLQRTLKLLEGELTDAELKDWILEVLNYG